MEQVQIVSRKVIKPSSPTLPHLRYLKLTPLDKILPPSYVSIILFYPTDGNSRADNRRLEASLSETLTHFYPLAGRHINDINSIDCGDQGVELWDAKAEGHLHQLLSRRNQIELLNPLVQCEYGVAASDTDNPLVVIQATVFKCGGLAMSLSISHKLCDAFSLAKFLTTWAAASKSGTSEVVGAHFDLNSFFPAQDLPMLNSPHPSKVLEFERILTKRFVFDGATISTLKSKLRSEPSRVVVVTALIWKAFIKISEAKHGHMRTSLASHAMNLRSRIAPEIPDNCCGNIVRMVNATFTPNKTKMELADLVGLVKDALSSSAAVRHEDVIPTAVKSCAILDEMAKYETVDVNMFSSWCRLPFYEADFGWGKPCWVSGCSNAVRFVKMLDTASGNGIEALVSLKEEDMLLFQLDEDIVAFTSADAA